MVASATKHGKISSLQPKSEIVFLFSVLSLSLDLIFPLFFPRNMSDALINGLAGAGGGIIAQLLTYPLQTVSLHYS